MATTTTRPEPQNRDLLSRRERAELHRALRWQRRIDRWEARRAGPPPPRHLHRAVITVLLLVMMLLVLALLLTAPTVPPAPRP